MEAGQHSVYSAESSWAAARAQRLPSFTLGADYYALSDQPAMQVNFAPLPIVAEQPFVNQDAGGVQGIITQPLYTSGRITAGIEAAQSGVHANQADLCRTVLDVKMHVAESFVIVLRNARAALGSGAGQGHQPGRPSPRRGQPVREGGRLKERLPGGQGRPADAQQQALEAANRLDIARTAYNRDVGRDLGAPVELAPLQDNGGAVDCLALTARALQQRPELTALTAQARAFQQQALAERAKNGPQVQLAGGYLYQENRYVEPNGVAGVLVGVQWNALDMGRAAIRPTRWRRRASRWSGCVAMHRR